jgi:hypothetical protein
MKRSIHRSVCAVIVLIALASTGCRMKQLIVQIPDFESSLVDGVQLWRGEDPASEVLSEAGRIVFGDCYSADGVEMIEYTMVDSQNQPFDFTFDARLVRSEDGDGATLQFVFGTWHEPAGWIRASSFNAAGESDLSAESVFL